MARARKMKPSTMEPTKVYMHGNTKISIIEDCVVKTKEEADAIIREVEQLYIRYLGKPKEEKPSE